MVSVILPDNVLISCFLISCFLPPFLENDWTCGLLTKGEIITSQVVSMH